MSTLLRLRLPVVIVVTLVLQRTVLDGIRIDGSHPDALLVIPIVVALMGGAERGAVVGFFTGLLADAFLPTPFGMSAMIFTLTGYSVGAIRESIEPAMWWAAPVAAAAASALAVIAMAVLGTLLGQPEMLHESLAATAVVVAAFNGLFAPLARPVLAWASVRREREGWASSTQGTAIGALR